MNVLSAEAISKKYGDKTLYKNLHLGINLGERIGIVGINGAGKSTLLKIFMGLILPDEGTVSRRKGIKFGYLGQQAWLDDHASVFENVFFSYDATLACIAAYERCLHEISLGKATEAALQQITDEMNRLDAWSQAQKVQEIIHRMGIGAYLYQPVASLSGGQRKRVSLAKTLLGKPDVLLLDEPTNHLDIETVEWLQSILEREYDTMLIITHDRYFLDAVCNQIWEVSQGAVFKYKGNYAYYLEKKAERESLEQVELEKNKNRFRKELEWIQRQPKARGTKAKYRIDAFEDLKKKISGKYEKTEIELSFKMERQGGKIGELRKLSKSVEGKVLFKDFSYTFKKFDRIGLLGKNGAGKTTLLNILTKTVPPDRGEVIWGETTKIGYYKQAELPFPEHMRLIECIKSFAETITLSNGSTISASQFLTKFLFPPQDQYKEVRLLSGGERKRLQLMQVLLQNPNFLILDEPTNDLDTGTLAVLEEFLEEFTGTLLLVSHDRYFMDKLVDHLWVLQPDGTILDFPGNYTDYKQYLEEKKEKQAISERPNEKENKIASKPTGESVKRKLSFKEQQELEKLDKEIAQLEDDIKQYTASLQSETEYSKLVELGKLLEQAQSALDAKTMRWFELQQMA